MRIAVTGVCASGKTTLVNSLRNHAVEAYNIAQEHSNIQTLWQKKNPDILVMLDATLPSIRRRRKVAWGQERLIVQKQRLAHARQHVDLFIQTDALTKEGVAKLVLIFLQHFKRVKA
ncbi:MAG: hypothetical protein E6713_15505 [Sporomusaceae bacterium]|nr:hypothetical protein [Sporomusaceae bacterium]